MQFDPVIQGVQMHVGSSNSDEKTTANKQAASMRGLSGRKGIVATKMEMKSKDKIC
jgi:hypothetical protein